MFLRKKNICFKTSSHL